MLYFKDVQQRYEIRLIALKLMNILTDKLIDEKLEPISIQIDCDKNKFPDIIEALKDQRNWV